jgi:D-3-phosphoglycerate dehydrogenase
MGMNVSFYDILQIMPLGCATPVDSLDQLLREVDFLTLHVPATSDTHEMIGERQLHLMKKGSYLINASRGNVVVIPALVEALKSGHLAGCAIDVYPKEPAANSEEFFTALQGCPNTILTPHIGGSTEEAQLAIGMEVSNALQKYINSGSTLGAVNFPESELRVSREDWRGVRLLNVHRNVPGVLRQVNNLLSRFNIEKQLSDSKGPIAYLLADVETVNEQDLHEIYEAVTAIGENIRTRLLY